MVQTRSMLPSCHPVFRTETAKNCLAQTLHMFLSVMKETKQPPHEWARCYYEAWNRRDWEWIAAMLADRVEWTHTARQEVVRGPNAVIASFRSAIDGFPTAMIEVRKIHSAGENLIVECAIVHASANKGTDRAPSFCEVFQIAHGRCIRGTTYSDSVRFLLDMSHAPAAA